MNDKYYVMLIIIVTTLLSACAVGKTIDEGKESPNVEISNTELNFLELTSKEADVYSNYQKDLSLNHLRELEPISIAKLYLRAGFDRNYDVEYSLYTDREKYIQWSKEADEKIPESDRGFDEKNIKKFTNIEKGTFIKTSEYEGCIQYDTGEETYCFQMINNEDGIWQVSFMPLQ